MRGDYVMGALVFAFFFFITVKGNLGKYFQLFRAKEETGPKISKVLKP